MRAHVAARSSPTSLCWTRPSELSTHKVSHVVLVNRGLVLRGDLPHPRDVDYALARKLHMDAMVPCEWVESTHPS